jgi:hypothetical protein
MEKPITYQPLPQGLREIKMPDSTMLPVINPGDRIYVYPVPVAELEAGDLVVVSDGDRLTVRDVAVIGDYTLVARQHTPPRTAMHPLRGISEVFVVHSIMHVRAGAA